MSVPDPATTKWVPLWNTGASSAAGSGMITGDLVWSVVATRPGSVACDGALYNSVTDPSFAALFAAIGTAYGGTGASSFAVPDVRGRLLVCRGTNPDVNAVGKNDGEPTVANRTPLHWHGAAGLSWSGSGSFSGAAGNTGTVSSDHTHYNNFNTSGRSADHAHYTGVSLDGSTSGNYGAHVGTDHGANVNIWTSGESVDHVHAVQGSTGGISANHSHAFTPAGSVGVSGSVAGYVGSPRNDQVQDRPAYIVENCFIVK